MNNIRTMNINPVLNWTSDDVYEWMVKYAMRRGNGSDVAKRFHESKVDGKMLMRLEQKDLVGFLGANSHQALDILNRIRGLQLYSKPLPLWSVEDVGVFIESDFETAPYSNEFAHKGVNGYVCMSLNSNTDLENYGITNSLHGEQLLKMFNDVKKLQMSIQSNLRRTSESVSNRQQGSILGEGNQPKRGSIVGANDHNDLSKLENDKKDDNDEVKTAEYSRTVFGNATQSTANSDTIVDTNSKLHLLQSNEGLLDRNVIQQLQLSNRVLNTHEIEHDRRIDETMAMLLQLAAQLHHQSNIDNYQRRNSNRKKKNNDDSEVQSLIQVASMKGTSRVRFPSTSSMRNSATNDDDIDSDRSDDDKGDHLNENERFVVVEDTNANNESKKTKRMNDSRELKRYDTSMTVAGGANAYLNLVHHNSINDESSKPNMNSGATTNCVIDMNNTNANTNALLLSQTVAILDSKNTNSGQTSTTAATKIASTPFQSTESIGFTSTAPTNIHHSAGNIGGGGGSSIDDSIESSIDRELARRRKIASKPRWFEVVGGGEANRTMKASDIARQARLDVEIKSVTRQGRLIIPDEIQRKVHLSDTDEDDHSIPPFIILPSHPYRVKWDILMMILVIYFAVITPINMAFSTGMEDMDMLELCLNLLFIVDIVLNFFTAFIISNGPQKGNLEMRHSAIARDYMRIWFWIDIAASIPLDIILKAAGTGRSGQFNKLVRLLRGFKLIRVLRMSRILGRLTKTIDVNPATVRLCKLCTILLFMWHWIGCFYWMLSNIEGFNSEWTPHLHYRYAAFGTQYAQAFFWAVMSTLGVGRDIIPSSNAETVFSIFTIALGVLMYAGIVSSASSALEQLDLATKQHRSFIENVVSYLKQRQVPKDLRRDILSYFNYLNERNLDSASRNLMSDLHASLNEELDLSLSLKLIKKVPLFRGLSRACLLSIIGRLQSRIYIPGEYICLAGERSTEMYFVLTGMCEGFKNAPPRRNVYNEGDFFCDIMSAARVDMNYRAVEYSEVRYLTRSSLKGLLKQFPEFILTVQKCSPEFQRLRKWKRLRRCIKLARVLNKLGLKRTVEDTIRICNDLEPKETSERFVELRPLL